jgi:hypothetical protein
MKLQGDRKIGVSGHGWQEEESIARKEGRNEREAQA